MTDAHLGPLAPDDWDRHWDDFGCPAHGNPANLYRQRLIVAQLGALPLRTKILDIGSGQGELAVHLRSRFPDAEVWGIEYSAEGVRRATLAAKQLHLPIRFSQRDLLEPTELGESDVGWATHAICSEVLEHVDCPEVLLRHARDYLAPGCRVVVTVPGGPRSAFDRHIGHRQHFSPSSLRRVLLAAGYEVERIHLAGFPFFNLYRLAVIARGKQLVADLNESTQSARPSGLMSLTLRAFGAAFRFNLPSSPLGWQVVATARPLSLDTR